jgi:hypothetical protein
MTTQPPSSTASGTACLSRKLEIVASEGEHRQRPEVLDLEERVAGPVEPVHGLQAEALGLGEVAEIELDVREQVGHARLVPVTPGLARNLDTPQDLALGIAEEPHVREHEAEAHVTGDQELAVVELTCQR